MSDAPDNPNQPDRTNEGNLTTGNTADPARDLTANEEDSIKYGSAEPGQPVKLTPAQEAAAGIKPGDQPKRVQMEALKAHSYDGEQMQVGTVYDADEQYVDALVMSGNAARADRVAEAQRVETARAARAAAPPKASRIRSTAVKPMATTDLPNAQPKE